MFLFVGQLTRNHTKRISWNPFCCLVSPGPVWLDLVEEDVLRWGCGRVVLELVCLVVPVRRPVLLLLVEVVVVVVVVVLLLVEGVVGGMRLELPRLELLGDMLVSRVVVEARRLLEAVLAVRVRPIELVAVGPIVSVGSAAAPVDVEKVVRVRLQPTRATGLLRWRIGRVAQLVARVVQLVIGVLRLLPVLVVLVRVEVR